MAMKSLSIRSQRKSAERRRGILQKFLRKLKYGIGIVSSRMILTL